MNPNHIVTEINEYLTRDCIDLQEVSQRLKDAATVTTAVRSALVNLLAQYESMLPLDELPPHLAVETRAFVFRQLQESASA